jgi:phosphoribosylanthranilate isomerase
MKVKVCGMTSFEQLQQLEDLGIDFAGLIFYEKSARFAGEKLACFKSQISNLKLKKVGVFVNANLSAIKKAVEDFGLNYVQLHGDESSEFCKEAQQFIPVIKVIRIGTDTNLDEQLQQFENACTYFLFDTDSKQYGGTGKQFNWEVLQSAAINKLFFLSGGIGLENIEQLKSFQHSNFFAADVNSRFETKPGTKDMPKVKQFLSKMKAEEKHLSLPKNH